MDNRDNDDVIVQSWHKNVDAWTKAIRSAEIHSRVTVTDAAIVNAVVAEAPELAAKVGWGEL